jgi:MFS transporter (putative signal transducer)
MAALAALLLLLALASVTQDIATDGMAVQALEPGQRGLGNTLQIGGSYLGYILGGGLLVVMVHRCGWQAGMLYFTALLALCTLPALWLRKRRLQSATQGTAQAPSTTPRLSRAWRRPELRWGMATVIAFQAPVRWFTGVMLPHLVDRGFAAGEAGLLSGAGMALAGITGALLGGWLLRRRGRNALIRTCQALYLALLLAYLLTEASGGQPRALLAALFLAFCTAMALGFVVLYTAMMDWASPSQAGTDYSLLQCTDAWCALVFGLTAATATHHLGYGASFAAAAILALAGLLLAPRLHARAQAAATLSTPPGTS